MNLGDDIVVAMAARLFLDALYHRAAGGVGVPLLIPNDAPPVVAGRCISCGISVPDGWRCPLCRVAVGIALEAFDLAERVTPGSDAGISREATAATHTRLDDELEARMREREELYWRT